MAADPLAWLSAPCVMGILNVTPDSFSDGGRHQGAAAARARLRAIAADGAVICDVGPESTRPGADPVPASEQLRRLAPVLDALAESPPAMAISIDTRSASVAGAAIARGAVLVNDVSGGRDDPDLLPLVAEAGAAVCLVHMRGTPRDMQDDPRYEDAVGEVVDFLATRVEAATAAGIPRERILVDPGIGFGKRLEDNLALLAGMDRIVAVAPTVVGVSRKGMFGTLLGRAVGERMAGSLAAALAAVARGAAVVRAHDVRETVDALRVWRAIAEVGTPGGDGEGVAR